MKALGPGFRRDDGIETCRITGDMPPSEQGNIVNLSITRAMIADVDTGFARANGALRLELETDHDGTPRFRLPLR